MGCHRVEYKVTRKRPSDFNELCVLSAQLGATQSLVQGAGGNISLKEEGVLWVKASGTWLSDAVSRNILVPLDLIKLTKNMSLNFSDPTKLTLLDNKNLRPSIETTLHALLPQRVVVHLHSVNAIALAVRSDGKTEIANRLKDIEWTWVPYARPGLPLTALIKKALLDCQTIPEVLVLANHGIVIGAETVEKIDRKIKRIEQLLDLTERPLRAPKIKILERLIACTDQWRLPEDVSIHAIATDPVIKKIAEGGVLYPDHYVFLGSKVTTIDDDTVNIDNNQAPYMLRAGAGVIIRRDISRGAEEMLSCLSMVGRRLNSNSDINFLTQQDIADLGAFDAESYRVNLLR